MSDYGLKLLAGLPIELENLSVYSPTLKEIVSIGEDTYNKFLNVSVITKEIIQNDSLHDVEDYDILVSYVINYQDFIIDYLKSLSFFVKQEFQIKEMNGDLFFVSENYTLNRKNYNDFLNAIKLANCIETKKEKPKSKTLSEIEEKIRKAKEKINQKINKNNDELNLFDLVSVLASNGNNLNILNVWDLNIFQFQNQFKRMQMIEEYDIGIRSLMAGADNQNIKHYIRKI